MQTTVGRRFGSVTAYEAELLHDVEFGDSPTLHRRCPTNQSDASVSLQSGIRFFLFEMTVGISYATWVEECESAHLLGGDRLIGVRDTATCLQGQQQGELRSPTRAKRRSSDWVRRFGVLEHRRV